jgi:hypothetical protein
MNCQERKKYNYLYIILVKFYMVYLFTCVAQLSLSFLQNPLCLNKLTSLFSLLEALDTSLVASSKTLLKKWAQLHQGCGISCLGVSIMLILMGTTIVPFHLTISFWFGVFVCFLDIYTSVCLLKFDEK